MPDESSTRDLLSESRHVVAVISGLVALAYLLVVICEEVIFGWPVDFASYLRLAALFTMSYFAALPHSSPHLRIAFFAALLVPLAILYSTPWNNNKALDLAATHVHRGMSDAEVRQVMTGFIEGKSERPHSLVFRADASFDCNLAIVTFKNGKVSGLSLDVDKPGKANWEIITPR
jgi:hypothetical protein